MNSRQHTSMRQGKAVASKSGSFLRGSHARPVDLEWLIEGYWTEPAAAKLRAHLSSCTQCRAMCKERRAKLSGAGTE